MDLYMKQTINDRSATAQVDPHSDRDLAGTGTNISYEGATAPGAGGSAGTGFASGKEATGEKLATSSGEDRAGRRSTPDLKGEGNAHLPGHTSLHTEEHQLDEDAVIDEDEDLDEDEEEEDDLDEDEIEEEDEEEDEDEEDVA
jgi:hypothetical protein